MKTLIITGGTGGLGTFVVDRLRRNYDCVLLRRDDMNDEQSIRAAPLNNGQLRVALTDAADNFLNVARDALQLQFGEIEIRALW